MRDGTINDSGTVCPWCEARPESLHATTCDANERRAMGHAVENIADDLRNTCDDGVFDVTVETLEDGTVGSAYGPLLVYVLAGDERRVTRGRFTLIGGHGPVGLLVTTPELGVLVETTVEDASEVVGALFDRDGVPWADLVPLERQACFACGEPIEVGPHGHEVERGGELFCDTDCLDSWTDDAVIDQPKLRKLAEALPGLVAVFEQRAAKAHEASGYDDATVHADTDEAECAGEANAYTTAARELRELLE